MEKRQELYKGKAKTVYATDDPHRLVMHYRDDVSAFDGVKLAKLDQKGETNNKINAFVMGKLAAAGVPTHFVAAAERARIAREGDEDAAGRMRGAQHLRGLDGQALRHRRGDAAAREPIFEFFLKSDALHDPLSTTTTSACWAGRAPSEIAEMQALTHKVNARAEAALRRCRHRSRRLQARVRPPDRRPRARSCWATSSRRTAAGSGTRRPARSSTRIASAAISGDVIEHYREVARRIGAPL